MGLDQTLFRTTKKCKEAKIAWQKLELEYLAKVKELDATEKWQTLFEILPRNQYGYLDQKKITPDQRKQIGVYRRTLRKIAKEVGIELNKNYRPWFNPSSYGLKEEELDEPIADWRKDWSLHKFIVDNFLEDKENDNLVPIYLTKEACEKIVAAGYVGGFQEALRRWDDEHEVFYWPWY